MSLTYDGIIHRSLEEQVRYDAEQVQLLKQADVTINENLQTVNTALNGKLTKPTNPSAESAVTMLADGTVGTKLLSEFGGGGKLYLHNILLTGVQNNFNYELYFKIYSSNNKSFTMDDLITYTPKNIYVYVVETEGYDERRFVGVINVYRETVNFRCSIVSEGVGPATTFISRDLAIDNSKITVSDSYIEL